MIKAVLFDMDGLMFDTERLTSDIWISIGQKYGYPITMEMMNRMRGLPLQGYLKIFYDELGDDFDYWKYRKIREQETNLYIDTYGVPVKKGLRELLQWLKENNYAVVLATSTHQDAACKLLQKADVYQYFDAFVFGNMVEKGKPNGEIFETAAKAAGIKVEEALVLEDSYAGVEAGWRAGCHVIMIPDMLPCRDIERERIDDCAESLLEIISFLKNNRAEAQLCSAGGGEKMSRQAKIIAIGDNVVDMYLSRGKMYPGGQCLNTCVYSQMNGGKTAYLGKFGDDAAAIHNCKVIDEIGIDNSHSRHYHGENGAARVTLINGDRVFLGSNKGGVAKEHPFDFTKEDLDYIKTFDLIYTNGNSYTLQDLPLLKATGLPIAYDFSDNWDQDTLAEICPYLQIALLSCSHLNDEERTAAMKKVASYGVRLVIGTVGSKGSYALYEDHISYAQAQMAENIMDTMGAGDSYFSTLLTTLLQYDGSLFADDKEEMQRRLQIAMEKGAAFAAKVVCMEGAFGYSAPIPKQ